MILIINDPKDRHASLVPNNTQPSYTAFNLIKHLRTCRSHHIFTCTYHPKYAYLDLPNVYYNRYIRFYRTNITFTKS